jgi:sensor histidine kinase YesM
LHCLIAELIGEPLASAPAGYHGSRLVLRFLEEFYSDIWMYWPLVGIRALMDSHARERERERQAAHLEKLIAESQLSMLRAQIQPHFLFNTLHAITTLLRVDPRAAEDMVADLSEILRASFAGSSAQELPLRQELELTRCYLRIQQRRLGERLHLEILIDPSAAKALVPALVLQSLVENAVVHGIAPLARMGHLQILARREGDELHLQVGDDGVGAAASGRGGVGLANARERLARLYGAAHALELTSSPGRGTLVRLRVPYRSGDTGLALGGTDDEDPHHDRGRRTARPAEPVHAAEARA